MAVYRKLCFSLVILTLCKGQASTQSKFRSQQQPPPPPQWQDSISSNNNGDQNSDNRFPPPEIPLDVLIQQRQLQQQQQIGVYSNDDPWQFQPPSAYDQAHPVQTGEWYDPNQRVQQQGFQPIPAEGWYSSDDHQDQQDPQTYAQILINPSVPDKRKSQAQTWPVQSKPAVQTWPVQTWPVQQPMVSDWYVKGQEQWNGPANDYDQFPQQPPQGGDPCAWADQQQPLDPCPPDYPGGEVPYVPICDVRVCLQNCLQHLGLKEGACFDNECYCRKGAEGGPPTISPPVVDGDSWSYGNQDAWKDTFPDCDLCPHHQQSPIDLGPSDIRDLTRKFRLASYDKPISFIEENNGAFLRLLVQSNEDSLPALEILTDIHSGASTNAAIPEEKKKKAKQHSGHTGHGGHQRIVREAQEYFDDFDKPEKDGGEDSTGEESIAEPAETQAEREVAPPSQEDEGNLIVKAGTYTLAAIDFHWGSTEHSIEGQTHNVEAQLHHFNLEYNSLEEALIVDGAVVSLAILFKADRVKSDLHAEIFDALDKVTKPNGVGVKLDEDTFLAFLHDKSLSNFGLYKGSMTSPPCQRRVSWLVSTNVFDISVPQVQKLQSLQNESGVVILNNARKQQKRNEA